MALQLKYVLKKLLFEHDMSVAQLSRATQIPQQTLNNWLTGQHPRNLDQLKKVADHFKITLDFLAYGHMPCSRSPLNELEEEINAGVYEVVLKRLKKPL